MGEELVDDVDQIKQLMVSCRRAGCTLSDIKRMCGGDMLARILLVVRGQAEVIRMTYVIDLDADPLIPYERWEVEEHRKGGQFIWNPEAVRLYLSLSQMRDKSINGNKLREELADLPVFNANLLDYLLSHSHLIPEEWKVDENGHTCYTCFWGTIFLSAPNEPCVRCLYFHKNRWQTAVVWLDRDWYCNRPAAVGAS